MTTADDTSHPDRGDAAPAAVGPLDVTFTAPIVKSSAKGGWTYLKTDWTADYFGTRGLVKVSGTVEGEPIETSLMAMGDGSHKLPITAALRSKVGKGEGDDVTVHLTERRGP